MKTSKRIISDHLLGHSIDDSENYQSHGHRVSNVEKEKYEPARYSSSDLHSFRELQPHPNMSGAPSPFYQKNHRDERLFEEHRLESASGPSSTPSTAGNVRYRHRGHPNASQRSNHSYTVTPGYGFASGGLRSSSFESYSRPHANSIYSHGNLSYRQPNSYSLYYQWPSPPSLEYISQIEPNDVLSGRGGATNSHSGNKAFRQLVKKYQDRYLQAKKRDKPTVASVIVEKIRDRGGRFLRRVNTTAQGQVLWIDIGDDRAREKTCQALREGAPELRRKRQSPSADEDEDVSPSNFQRTRQGSFGGGGRMSEDFEADVSRDAPSRKTTNTSQLERRMPYYPFPVETEPIAICPSKVLVRRMRVPESISIDQLDSHEREIYLRDFLPPNPGIRRSKEEGRRLRTSQHVMSKYPDDDDDDNEQASTWKIVKV